MCAIITKSPHKDIKGMDFNGIFRQRHTTASYFVLKPMHTEGVAFAPHKSPRAR